MLFHDWFKLRFFSGFSHCNDSLKNYDSESGSRSEQRESSDDEFETRNTIRDVPFEWYKEDEHIGYDKVGRKIKKMERMHKLGSILATSARRRFSESKSRLPDAVRDNRQQDQLNSQSIRTHISPQWNSPNLALIKDEVTWFSTSGDNIASASVDGTIRIWTYDSSTSAVINATIYCGAEIMSLK
ncbi:WD repeat-containing protein 91 [Tanacetum coccineum]